MEMRGSPGLYAVGGSVKPPFAPSVPEERDASLSAAAWRAHSLTYFDRASHAQSTLCALRKNPESTPLLFDQLPSGRQYGSQGSTPLVGRELTSLCDSRVFLLLNYNGGVRQESKGQDGLDKRVDHERSGSPDRIGYDQRRSERVREVQSVGEHLSLLPGSGQRTSQKSLPVIHRGGSVREM